MRRVIYGRMFALTLCLVSAPSLGTAIPGPRPSPFQRADLPHWPQRLTPVKQRNLGIPRWILWSPALTPLGEPNAEAVPRGPRTNPQTTRLRPVARPAHLARRNPSGAGSEPHFSGPHPIFFGGLY